MITNRFVKLIVISIVISSRKKQQSGFSLAIAMLFGFLLLTLGIAISVRGIKDTELVVSQKQAMEAQSAAEIGITRVQEQLQQNRALIKNNQDTWSAILDGSTPEGLHIQKFLKICNTTEQWQKQVETLRPYAKGDMQSLQNNDQFKLEKYRYFPDKNIGQIITQGKSGDSVVYLQVLITVTTSESQGFVPVLWVRSQGAGTGTGKNYINGDLRANNCDFPLDKVYLVSASFKAENTALDFPDLPSLDAAASRIPDAQKHLNISDSSTELTFPRPGDLTTGEMNGVPIYEYIVDSVNLNSKQLTIKTSGYGVVFYALGSVKGEIKHSCDTTICKASNFIILGYGGNSKVNLGVYAPAPQVCLKGSGDLSAFVFAPYYEMGLKKVGSAGFYFNFYGSAWIDKWDVSGLCGETKSIRLLSSIQWPELSKDFLIDNPYPTMGNITRWNLINSSDVNNPSLDVSTNSNDPVGLQSAPYLPPLSDP